MSFRLPQNFSGSNGRQDPLSALEGAVIAEKAATLGLAGRKLERSLAAFRADPDGDCRDALLDEAAEAAHHYLIQRELCGLRDHRSAIEEYQIPRQVMARVGVRQNRTR